jgi:putative tryptophan/tyrosine transport system substrate-binding protein
MRRREVITLLGGAAAAWPLAARAQEQPAMPVIGFMSARSPEDSAYLLAAFRQGLNEVGFLEGQNIAIELRWARGQYDRLPALAAELVQRRVAVLAALGGDLSSVTARQATSIIPIVFGMGADPVEHGLVDSFSRPGGNATGYTILTSELEPKRIGLLHELVPAAPLIGALLGPDAPRTARQLQEIEDATRSLKRRLVVAKAGSDTELDAAFASLSQQRVGTMLVAASAYFDTRRERIIAFAAKSRIPAIYQLREYAVSGGLISYGPRIADSYRQAGVYVGRILRGAKPADLPVLQPTRFELVINLKTANALGLTVPNAMQLLADEVIE